MTDKEGDPKPLVAEATEPVMSAVSVRLPPIWRGDPHIWFAQAEAPFATRQITQESTKFAHVTTVLQPEVAQELRDLLINLHPTTLIPH